MSNRGKTAIGAILAALALLVLTGITLHETVFMWFLAACAAAYVACVTELLVRRRHKTLAASGAGSILFIAFGIAFLRQWGLAFNPDPEALSAPVDAEHPDLYFFLAAASGAATLLLLFAGTVLPGNRKGLRSGGSRRPAPRPAQRLAGGQASRPGLSRPGTSRQAAPRAPKPPAGRAPTSKAPAPAAKRPAAPRPAAQPAAARTAAKKPAKPPAKSPPRPARPTAPRR